jgi:hypothetical protein
MDTSDANGRLCRVGLHVKHGLRYIAEVIPACLTTRQVRVPNAHDQLYVCSAGQDIRYLDAETRGLSKAYISDIEVCCSTEPVASCRPRR